MIYGYARCSTNETKQDINRQIRELKASGAEEIFFEYEHGDAAVKEQLSSLLNTAREGDTIITLEVPRLARSTKQATVRDYRARKGSKIAPCDCWQYHGGLHQGRA